MWAVLSVSLSGLHAWKAQRHPELDPAERPASGGADEGDPRRVPAGLGSRRLPSELRDRGYRIGLSDVERRMREHGIRTRRKRRFKGRLRTPGMRCRVADIHAGPP